MSLHEKMSDARNPAANLLCKLAVEKKSNVILGLDLAGKTRLKDILQRTAGEVVAIKTHVDIIEGFDFSWWESVLDICKENSIMVFEDRKFADIGSTVRMQYESGDYRIADWANLVTCHSVAGPGTVEGIKAVASKKVDGLKRGAIMIAQMTSSGNLATGEYTDRTVELAENSPDFCAGFIGNASEPAELSRLAKMCPKGMLVFAPGVKAGGGHGTLGQRHSTPSEAVGAGADFIIVSSGICESFDPLAAAKEYRKEGWIEKW